MFRATSSGRMIVEIMHSRVISRVYSATQSGSKDLIGWLVCPVTCLLFLSHNFVIETPTFNENFSFLKSIAGRPIENRKIVKRRSFLNRIICLKLHFFWQFRFSIGHCDGWSWENWKIVKSWRQTGLGGRIYVSKPIGGIRANRTTGVPTQGPRAPIWWVVASAEVRPTCF